MRRIVSGLAGVASLALVGYGRPTRAVSGMVSMVPLVAPHPLSLATGRTPANTSGPSRHALVASCGTNFTITPCTSSATVAPVTQAYKVFTVQNNSVRDVVASTGCTLSGAISSCAASPSTITMTKLGGYAAFTVTYTTSSSGVSGVVNGTVPGWGLSAQVNVTVQYFTVSTAFNNNNDQDVRLCEASCFAASYAQSTVPSFSLDAPRTVTLVYHGDRVAVRPFVYADVSPATGPTPQQYWLQAKVNGSRVTFVNGEQTLHFSASSSPMRLAGQFDASYLSGGTGMYPFQVIVTAQYATFNAQQIDSSSKLMVINERKSPIARGWTVAGLERLYIQSDSSALITDGNGSGVYFPSCGSGCFNSPTGDFSKLAGNSGGGYTRSYVDSTKEAFNTVGQLIAVTDANLDTVAFAYDSIGRLIGVTDPYRTVVIHCSDAPCEDTLHESIALMYNAYGLDSIVDICPNLLLSPNCRRTTISVGSDSTLQAIEDPDSISTYFRYDARRRLSAVVDRRGDSTRFVYRRDSSWKLDSLVLPAVPVDGGGGRTTMQSPAFTLAAWQVAGVPMTSTSGSPATPVATNAPSDTVIDPEGHLTRSTVDRWGEALTITDALGGLTTITRNGILPTAVAYPSGGVDSARYEGGLVVWVRPAGRDSTRLGTAAASEFRTALGGRTKLPNDYFSTRAGM